MPNHDEYDPFAQDSELSQAIGGQAGGDEALDAYGNVLDDYGAFNTDPHKITNISGPGGVPGKAKSTLTPAEASAQRAKLERRLSGAKNKLLAIAGQSVLESGLVTAEDRILAYQYLKAVNPDAVIPDFAKGEDTNIGEQTVVYDTTKNNGAPK